MKNQMGSLKQQLITIWFNEYQHSFQEKQKAQAREAFKKSEQTQKESK